MKFISVDSYTAVQAQCKGRPSFLPQSRKQALKEAATRQACLEDCMPLGPVLALRPGVALTPSEVARFVTANRPLLDRQTSRLSNMVQFQIMVHWDEPRVLENFRHSPELSPLFQIGQTSPTRLQHAINTLGNRIVDQMRDLLEPVSAELLYLPTEEAMLLNSVVMLPLGSLPDLDNAVERIDAIWTEGLRIRQIGPAPAASFVQLDPLYIPPAELAAALDQFGKRTTVEIDALRRQALLENPQAAASIRHTAEIARAAQRLEQPETGFHLCAILSEDQAVPKQSSQVVA